MILLSICPRTENADLDHTRRRQHRLASRVLCSVTKNLLETAFFWASSSPKKFRFRNVIQLNAKIPEARLTWREERFFAPLYPRGEIRSYGNEQIFASGVVLSTIPGATSLNGRPGAQTALNRFSSWRQSAKVPVQCDMPAQNRRNPPGHPKVAVQCDIPAQNRRNPSGAPQEGGSMRHYGIALHTKAKGVPRLSAVCSPGYLLPF